MYKSTRGAGSIQPRSNLASRQVETGPTIESIYPSARDGSRALAMEMDLVQALIELRRASKLAFGSDRVDLAGVHENDPVGELEGSEAVRDEEGGPADGELLNGLSDQGFVLNIDGACRFVENQDRGVAKHGAG